MNHPGSKVTKNKLYLEGIKQERTIATFFRAMCSLTCACAEAPDQTTVSQDYSTFFYSENLNIFNNLLNICVQTLYNTE